MRMLGIRSSLSVYRWDLIYLFACLSSDERPEIQALGSPVEAGLAEIRSEREAHEAVEDTSIITAARRGKRDASLDSLLIRFGGVARVSDKGLYDAAFNKYNPTETARLALADEVKEVGRILGEIRALPADNPLRLEYEPALDAALEAVKDAIEAADDATTALALSRSRLERFKLRMDELRLETHGRLLAILKSKAAVDAFFRSTTKAPGTETDEESEPEEPTGEAATAG